MEALYIGLLLVAAISASSGSFYDITVYTSSDWHSGTNANVKIRMYGSLGISNVHTFRYRRSYFESGSVDRFSVDFKQNLGDIFMISIGHDNSALFGNGWKPTKVIVQRQGSSKKSEFPINKWLENPNTYVSVTRTSKGDCGDAAQSRVVNGEDAKKSQWPWQAQIMMASYRSHVCGGTLIHPQYVLTASHCIENSVDSPETFKVVLGEHNLTNAENTEQEFDIEKIIKHQGYNRNDAKNDIALIKLDRAAMLTPHVKMACLPDHGEYVKAGEKCFITGWGRLYGGGRGPMKLQQAMLPTVSNQECKNKMKKVASIPVTDNMLCAGGNQKSGCHGDSGGPFVCQKSDGRFTVQGAVSWGSSRCQVNGSYTVFTRVGHYVDWIEQHIYSNFIKESEM